MRGGSNLSTGKCSPARGDNIIAWRVELYTEKPHGYSFHFLVLMCSWYWCMFTSYLCLFGRRAHSVLMCVAFVICILKWFALHWGVTKWSIRWTLWIVFFVNIGTACFTAPDNITQPTLLSKVSWAVQTWVTASYVMCSSNLKIFIFVILPVLKIFSGGKWSKSLSCHFPHAKTEASSPHPAR